jgi:SAM-dependent methyltransferase
VAEGEKAALRGMNRVQGFGPGFDYDAELRRYQERLRAAVDVHPGDQVLDIGCGTGLTTREAARAAAGRGHAGSALGVDRSARMLAHARRLSAREGLHNIAFELADAQVHGFPPQRFSLGISRFGTMFFADPVAAFTNIGQALRPGARLVQLVWQGSEHQEWSTAMRRALGDGQPLSAPGGDPFSLADPATVNGILTRAGFTDVRLADVREPVYYGPDTAAACDAVLRLREPADLLAGMDAARAERALDRLRTIIAAHDSDDGVWFDARAWLITARA